MRRKRETGVPYCLKLFLLGDYGAGKTSFIDRFISNTFSLGTKPTVGCDFVITTKKAKESGRGQKRVVLQLWEATDSSCWLRPNILYSGSHALIVLYDITNRVSFTSVRNRVESARKHAADAVVVVAAAKCDLPRAVSFEEGKALADSLEAVFIETSAKEGVAVDLAVSAAVAYCRKTGGY